MIGLLSELKNKIIDKTINSNNNFYQLSYFIKIIFAKNRNLKLYIIEKKIAI